MSKPLSDGEKEKVLLQKQADAARPIDQDPLYVQLNERFDRLRFNAENFFLEELNVALGSKYLKWKDALENIAINLYDGTVSRANSDNRGEANANAELIKANELLDTLMKRAEADWTYLHTQIGGLKCLKEGTWKEATDELRKEIEWLQSENRRLTQLAESRVPSPIVPPAPSEDGDSSQPSKQRAEGEPPAPCGVVESEDPSKSEPTKEVPPEQARRAAQEDDPLTDPFYKVVGMVVQAYPLVRGIGRIIRGKRVE
jgi:hypothetical protein